mgnify:CR=1 FL=1
MLMNFNLLLFTKAPLWNIYALDLYHFRTKYIANEKGNVNIGLNLTLLVRYILHQLQ